MATLTSPKEFRGVLAETTALARERGWNDVVRFVDTLPAPVDGALLLVPAERTETTALVDWLTSTAPGITVKSASAQAVAADPGVCLAANRVVAAFPAGELLSPLDLEIAAQLAARPAASYALLFVAAETLVDADDLDQWERGVSRVLLDSSLAAGEEELARRRCLLWSAHPGPGPVGERAARDTAGCAAWLRTPVAEDADLERLRALHALDLCPTVGAPGPAVSSTSSPAASARLLAVRDELGDLRRRLLGRLDAESTEVVGRVAATLQNLEQDMRREVGAATGEGAVLDVVQDGLARWQADTGADLARRARQIRAEAEALLSGVDWKLVNEAVPRSDGTDYPAALLTCLDGRGAAGRSSPDPLFPAVPAADWHRPVASAEQRSWEQAALVAICSGAVAAATTVVVGPVALPVAAAGALGAAGGWLLSERFGDREARQALARHGRVAVSRAITAAVTTSQQELRESAAAVRRALAAEFDRLVDAMDAAVREASAPAAAARGLGSPAQDADRLIALRRRLVDRSAQTVRPPSPDGDPPVGSASP